MGRKVKLSPSQVDALGKLFQARAPLRWNEVVKASGRLLEMRLISERRIGGVMHYAITQAGIEAMRE